MTRIEDLEQRILKLSVLETVQLANLLEKRTGPTDLTILLKEMSYSIVTAFTGVRYT